MADIRRLMAMGVLGGKKLSPAEKVKALFGASLIAYWKLSEESGTNADDFSGNNRNGVYCGVTLGAESSIIGNPAPAFDGINDIVDVYSASFNTAFGRNEGALFLFIKIPEVVMTDGVERTLVNFYADVHNQINIKKLTTNYLRFEDVGNWTSKSIKIPSVNYNWCMISFSWSDSGDYINGFLNGAKKNTINLVPNWTANLSSTNTILGGFDTSTENVSIAGNLSDVFLLNRPATEEEHLLVYKYFVTPKTVSILGDSISINELNGWAERTFGSYNTGKNTVKNHAVAGQGIISGMDAQVVAVASDNANIIIIALGTNDNPTGNMAVLQAEAEENIIELKASNPNATIYWMNVLPRWTDVGGGTEFDYTNVRVAIASACAAQGIVCWDTHTSHWIDAADTLDGIHPNAAGHEKIKNRVLALLP